MPSAREALLEAAGAAVAERPWDRVRMTGVAAAAGVSRQSLYNEFGDKAGLGAALAAHRTAVFLDRFLVFCRTRRHQPRQRALAAATDWIVAAAREDHVVRAALTGCAGTGPPSRTREPWHLIRDLRDRAADAFRARGGPPDAETRDACETAVRLAVSYLVVPAVPGP
ncbi:TetR/AcrR family transcriptional regulator [Streptomyces marincola]|uniref:TetR/AcrR family transcriptional regulator n=1 Tax=Streptomyces marincola TaxID=2878388 RepID=UPI0021002335|nr:TetR/AcrR family transcriptional regulator [Streptomyces marincola]